MKRRASAPTWGRRTRRRLFGAKVPLYRRRKLRVRKLRKPARFVGVSRRASARTRRIANTLSLVGENKFQGFRKDGLLAVAKPGGSQKMSYVFFNSGEDVSSTYSDFLAGNALDCLLFPQGEGPNNRIGSFMYAKQSTVRIMIEVDPIQWVYEELAPTPLYPFADMEFRFMVVKLNRKYQGIGEDPAIGNDLFLDTQNGYFGWNGTVASANMYHTQPINKRDYIVVRDQRFKMSAPSVSQVFTEGNPGVATPVDAISSYRPKYASTKRLKMSLRWNKKIHFKDNNADRPDNIDSQYFFIVQAQYANPSAARLYAGVNPAFRVSVIGTTSALDS